MRPRARQCRGGTAYAGRGHRGQKPPGQASGWVGGHERLKRLLSISKVRYNMKRVVRLLRERKNPRGSAGRAARKSYKLEDTLSVHQHRVLYNVKGLNNG